MKDKWMNKLMRQLTDSQARKGVLVSVGFWFAALLYWELILHAAVFGMPDGRFGYVAGFSFGFACLLAIAAGCLFGRANFWIMVATACVLMVLYGSQLVYFFVFGDLYAVSQMQQGGAAVTSFWVETVATIGNHLPWMLALFVPPVVLAVLGLFCRRCFSKTNPVWITLLAAAAICVTGLVTWSVSAGGTGYFTDHYFYYNEQTTTNQATERFGLLTAFRLNIFGTGRSGQTELLDYPVPETQIQTEEPTQSAGTEPAETEPAATEPVVTYNVLEIDFDKLNETTTDEKLLSMNQYFEALPGTKKNAYTGMLSEYNLIVLCAEAFATGAIHEELTPTLYRMSTEGIIFNNFYNTFPNNTTDGEYTMCMGLYPDIKREKDEASFFASRNSYLPFCLGNAFLEQRGIQSYGYHNHTGQFYGRNQSHPNMGYIMQFADDGLELSPGKPASDLEMMQQSVDDYISRDRQFHAYYMTFSGHLLYSVELNTIAAKNWDLVKDLEGLNDLNKCYLACNIELDRALEYLMQRLEEAGIADKTAIVLAGDHFPYGLYDHYEDLVGYKLDALTKNKSSLLFWVGGLEENIVVDEYCCNADILPTILNLWGFDYDSRLLAGTDVFSEGTHIAILRDMSFLTDKVWLNASTGEIRYQVEESEVPEGYIEELIRLVQTKYAMSSDILNKAYYNYIFGKESVVVGRDVWGENPDG